MMGGVQQEWIEHQVTGPRGDDLDMPFGLPSEALPRSCEALSPTRPASVESATGVHHTPNLPQEQRQMTASRLKSRGPPPNSQPRPSSPDPLEMRTIFYGKAELAGINCEDAIELRFCFLLTENHKLQELALENYHEPNFPLCF